MNVIAIDGPAASGKSSVSRRLAKRLGFVYVNSGTMYRAITWEVLRQGVDTTSASDVAEALSGSDIVCGIRDSGESFIHINSGIPDAALRDSRVNLHVSLVSAVPAVRDLVSTRLRLLAKDRDVVMEGRDIGSAVFPETPFKFYLDASPEIRRRRRAAEGQSDEIEARDKMDSSRKAAPLKIAGDARVVDTSHLTLDGVVEAILDILRPLGLAPR
ncbi:MAG: (d)CMP kinase [Terrimicrobiaceae bacterium]|nr:(d)CMP kinase [Terrimicrobiaceae bacterium]